MVGLELAQLVMGMIMVVGIAVPLRVEQTPHPLLTVAVQDIAVGYVTPAKVGHTAVHPNTKATHL